MTCGVPQGLVVGPIPWNLTYDLPLAANSELIGFADDTLVLISGKTTIDLKDEANYKLALVAEEIRSFGIELAVSKTEAVLITNKYKFNGPELKMNGQSLVIKKEIYLGVIEERNLMYKAHISEAALKAKRVLKALAQLIPNIGGPKHQRRKLLVSVILLYSAFFWAGTLKYCTRNSTQINRVQRRALLRSFCAYSTLSEIAVNILPGIPPADLLARERSAKFSERRIWCVKPDSPERQNDRTLEKADR